MGVVYSDTLTEGSLSAGWTRHVVTSANETWTSSGLTVVMPLYGFYYRSLASMGLSASDDFSVEIDLNTVEHAMVGPSVIDSANGAGDMGFWYYNPAGYLVGSISNWGYGGTYKYVSLGTQPSQSRLRITYTAATGLVTTAYSTDEGTTWSAETPTLAAASGLDSVGFGNMLSSGDSFTFSNFVVRTPDTGVPTGTATGTLSLVGTAHGVQLSSGTASGVLSFAGTAHGVAPAVATASGTATGGLSLVGSAHGTRLSAGTASGVLSFAGTAHGVAPAIAIPTGTATGSLVFAGVAHGSRASLGSALGALNLVGVAHGTRSPAGTASGLITLAGSAHGKAPQPHPTILYPVRVTITTQDRDASITTTDRKASITTLDRLAKITEAP